MDPSNSKTLLYSAQSWLFLRVMSAACIFLILILIPIDRQIISRGSVCHCSCSTNNPRGMHRWSGEVSSSLVPRLKMHWVPKHLFLASTLLATQSLHRLRCRCELSWVFCLLAWLLNRNSSNQCHVNLLFVSMSPLNLLPLSIHFTHMSTFKFVFFKTLKCSDNDISGNAFPTALHGIKMSYNQKLDLINLLYRRLFLWYSAQSTHMPR